MLSQSFFLNLEVRQRFSGQTFISIFEIRVSSESHRPRKSKASIRRAERALSRVFLWRTMRQGTDKRRVDVRT